MDLSKPNQRRWFHFSLVGRTRMAESVADAIIISPTTGPGAKELARQLKNTAVLLRDALRERMD